MRTRTREVLLRCAAVAVGLVLIAVAVEVVGAIALHFEKQRNEPQLPEALRSSVTLRNYGISTEPDPYLLFRLTPDHRHELVQTNRYGLHNPPIDADPGPETYRILLLGGSVSFGHTSTSNDDTISAFLEEFLNERSERHQALRGLEVEVLNAGVPGYVAWQGALAYSIHQRQLQARAIISLDGTNEVAAAIQTRRPGWPMQFDASAMPYLPSKPTLARALGSWLEYRFERAKIVRYLRARSPRSLDRSRLPAPEEVAAAYRSALEHLADLARLEGALLMPVLQPMSILSGAKPLTPFEARVVEYNDHRIPGVNAYYEESFEAFRAMLARLAAARPELLVMDATGVFSEVGAVTFTAPCHLTPSGRRLLAEAIGGRLLARLDETVANGTGGGS